MTCPWCRVFIVIVVAVTDVAVYIYNMHVIGTAAGAQPVSYAAHLAGAITGLLVGITCLKNLRWETHERYVWAVSATIFILLIGSAVVFSVAYPSWFVGVPELYEELLKNCTTQNLLWHILYFIIDGNKLFEYHKRVKRFFFCSLSFCKLTCKQKVRRHNYYDTQNDQSNDNEIIKKTFYTIISHLQLLCFFLFKT